MSSPATPWLAEFAIARGNVPVRKIAVRKRAVRAVPVAAGAAAPGAKYSNGYILQPLTRCCH